MLASLLPLLLTLRGVLTEPAQSFTFKATDPITGSPVVCDQCPPGTYLRASCTSTQKSVCAPCPPGSFTEIWNYIGKCLRCGVCGHNQVVKTACSAKSDCKCECKQGYYYQERNDMCVPHSVCPSGQGVLTPGTPHADTVCHICPNGTFSDTTSAHQKCTEHKHCDAGQHQLLKGCTWHDSVCTSCGALQSKDGAEYLKEILPSFFVHHKIPNRRLRRIVNNLPTAGGKRLVRASGLDLSSDTRLHEQINTWVASATVDQIRQLPSIMTKVRVSGSGKKLQSKLERIDSCLDELCASRNEVDVVVSSG